MAKFFIVRRVRGCFHCSDIRYTLQCSEIRYTTPSLKMKQKRFKHEVIGIFQQLTGKEFTVRQALESYMTLPSKTHTELKSARQFVHRNILRLMATGELVKINADGRSHKYLMTAQFNSRLTEVKVHRSIQVRIYLYVKSQ